MLRIGVDAMGGDYAPQAVIQGALSARNELGKESTIVLFGDKDKIAHFLAEESAPADIFEIVHTSEVIEMEDSPAKAFSHKPDSSIVVGFQYLNEGKIDGFASAGSTGAMMVGCMYVVKQIEGIIRPTISSVISTAQGGSFVLLDVGLNVDCRPEVLSQYGLIGSLYAQNVLGISEPRVALLNIGEEKEKGNLLTKAAYELMAEGEDFNFVGNIEAKYIFTGDIADVVVCDGFVGNSLLKEAEGIYEILRSRGVHDEFLDGFNYEMVGGTPVIGINSTVIIGHGCSSPLAIKNMILQTEKTIKADLASKIRERLS